MDNETIERIEQLSKDSCIAASDIYPGAALNAPAVVVPGDRKILSLEPFLDNPVRQRVIYATERLTDFCRYIEDEADSGFSAVFVKPDGSGALGVIDFGTRMRPGWGDHTAKLRMKHTPEFTACHNIDGKAMDQRSLIEWLEDWAHCIKAENEDGEAIDVTRAITALRKIDLKATIERGNEEKNFGVTKTALEEIEATSGHGAMPANLIVTCAVYEGTSIGTVTMRLSLLTTHDKPMLRVRMIGRERLLQAVAAEVETHITEQLDETVGVYVGEVDLNQP